MNLVRAIFEPTPPPVIVERIPEYNYVHYAGEYIPYYEGWLFLDDGWFWAGTGRRPPKPPAWTPPPRPHHQAPPHHKLIALPDHHFGHGFGHEPAPVFRHEEKRPEPPRTVVVRPAQKEKVTAKPESKKTEARPVQKEKEKATAKPAPKKTEARPAQKEKEKVTAKPEPKKTEARPAQKENEKVTVQPDRRHDTPPKKGR